jgi:type III pantothenate kinase
LIWAIDIGNTRTVSGLMLGNEVLRHDLEPTKRLGTMVGATAWAKRLLRRGSVKGLVVSSVVPKIDPFVRSALKRYFGSSPLFVRTGPHLGIKVLYKNPAEVGADRLMNSLAAREIFGAPVVVVDYGTATTFDVVDAKGRYQGGVILPGIGTSLDALHRFTAKLPSVKFKKVPGAIGRTTKDAMRSGVYHGAVGQTREILLNVRDQIGRKAPAIATGGWCRLFKDSGLFDHICPDLTLEGMAIHWRHQRG